MILQILFVVVMFLWFLIILPVPATEPYSKGSPFFAFVAVLLLGLYIFMPGLR